MQKLIFTIVLLFALPALAIEGRFSGGFGIGERSSSLEKSNGLPLVKKNEEAMFVLGADLALFWSLALYGKLLVSSASSHVQYNYTEGALNTTDDNLKAQIARFQTDLGLKYNLLNGSFFKLYAGGHGIYGGLGIVYDPADFDSRHNDHAGFKESDGAPYLGYGYIIGLDLTGQKFGIRLEAEREKIRTKSIETISGKKLTFEHTQFTISYLQKF